MGINKVNTTYALKNLFYLCLTFLLSTHMIRAQVGTQTDSIGEMSNFTVYGEASTYLVVSSVSINFERRLYSSSSQKFHLYGRAGYGYVDVQNLFFCSGKTAVGGLFSFTILTGKGDHHFEADAGIYFGTFKNKEIDSWLISGPCNEKTGSRVIPLIDLGYRYQIPEGGFLFRARAGTYGLGVGFGYAF